MPDAIGAGTSVSQVAARWLAVYVATARSSKNMGMAAQRVRDYLAPYMGEMPIENVRADTVRTYRLWLEERELSPRSVRHLLTDVRCMLGWAVEAGSLERNPFPRRVMPRIQESAPDRLTDRETEAVLGIPEPHAFVVRLALGTGMRWAEMCRARREHFQAELLVIQHTKSARLRRIPVPEELALEIAWHVGPLVPYTEAAAGSFNRFVQRNSGVERFHVHQLRHTFACKWIERGGSLPALQQILGHASVVTTQMYARLSDDALRREAARIHGASLHVRPYVS